MANEQLGGNVERACFAAGMAVREGSFQSGVGRRVLVRVLWKSVKVDNGKVRKLCVVGSEKRM